MRQMCAYAGFALVTFVLSLGVARSAPPPDAPVGPKLLAITSAGVVEVSWVGQKASLRKGQRLGVWTLMAVVSSPRKSAIAVFEDFTQKKGHILFVDQRGVQVDLPKSLEPSFADPSGLYRGHSFQEVMGSDHDLLGEEILAKAGDPDYDEVAACFPPISKMKTYTFVGTHDNMDKIGFRYGGRTERFFPDQYVPQIEKIRQKGQVWDGLVGGWLPAVRFVYPEESGSWTELIAYAPMRMDNGNNLIQPVWYRMSRVEDNELKWVRYFDSYHPFPPRLEYPAEPFYEELLGMREGWNRAMGSAMTIAIPDERLANMARHSLVRDMITRMGKDPRYGVYDKDYGGNEHAGFPDTFNADTTAMLEWGLWGLAADYIDNYFGKYVRDDGSILYRGPETGQYGRMLTVVAEYANYTRDYKLLLAHRRRIDAVTQLLLSMREKALKLAPSDPAYGMIAGTIEADSTFDPNTTRYMQPYFSNSTEAARGFRDLGEVWERMGEQSGRKDLTAWGWRLVAESQAMRKDLQTSIRRSILKDTHPICLPAVAGAKEPFDVAIDHDVLDPQVRSYRAYMEMLFSGILTREQVAMIVNYRAAHRDILLGIPLAYGYQHDMQGFLTYGHGYGLLQHDFVREYLLTLYSIMANHYTRGTWTAPESRATDLEGAAGSYCTPAQLVVPLMTRWMLAFEDPQSDTLWLAKGTPRSWLEEGKKISVTGAPTRWGRVSFTLTSQVNQGKVEGQVELPASFAGTVKLRLRLPEGRRIQSATVNGRPAAKFDPEEETVTLPPGLTGRIPVEVICR
ncbi:MAG: hypothetical protein ABSG32_28670 [Terriglobia bacterium]